MIAPGGSPGSARRKSFTALPQARGPRQTPLLRLHGWEARAQRNARSDKNKMHFSIRSAFAAREPSADRCGITSFRLPRVPKLRATLGYFHPCRTGAALPDDVF